MFRFSSLQRPFQLGSVQGQCGQPTDDIDLFARENRELAAIDIDRPYGGNGVRVSFCHAVVTLSCLRFLDSIEQMREDAPSCIIPNNARNTMVALEGRDVGRRVYHREVNFLVEDNPRLYSYLFGRTGIMTPETKAVIDDVVRERRGPDDVRQLYLNDNDYDRQLRAIAGDYTVALTPMEKTGVYQLKPLTLSDVM